MKTSPGATTAWETGENQSDKIKFCKVQSQAANSLGCYNSSLFPDQIQNSKIELEMPVTHSKNKGTKIKGFIICFDSVTWQTIENWSMVILNCLYLRKTFESKIHPMVELSLMTETYFPSFAAKGIVMPTLQRTHEKDAQGTINFSIEENIALCKVFIKESQNSTQRAF